MGKEYSIIDSKIEEWISQQKIFFVSTAPLSGDGLVNCSPKGMDTFRVISERTIAYLDFTGSGVETIAHLKENQRIVVMMCAFEGPPKIFRFHGQGQVFKKGGDGYQELISHFDESVGARSIISIDVDRICDSCGFTVPEYEYVGERDGLIKWSEKQGEEGVAEYQQNNNKKSIEGLEGI